MAIRFWCKTGKSGIGLASLSRAAMLNKGNLTEAVIREIKEETGLTISAPRLCGIKDWCEEGRRYVVLLYKTEQFSGTLQSSDEGKVWWENLENLPNLNLATKDMKDMLRVFTEDDLSEFFYRQEGDQWVCELK